MWADNWVEEGTLAEMEDTEETEERRRRRKVARKFLCLKTNRTKPRRPMRLPLLMNRQQ